MAYTMIIILLFQGEMKGLPRNIVQNLYKKITLVTRVDLQIARELTMFEGICAGQYDA